MTTMHPQPGDERAINRFAWLPVRLGDGSWCHLRWYRAQQVYDATDAEPWGPAFDWRTVHREAPHQT